MIRFPMPPDDARLLGEGLTRLVREADATLADGDHLTAAARTQLRAHRLRVIALRDRLQKAATPRPQPTSTRRPRSGESVAAALDLVETGYVA